jgi:GTP-binding protein Era
LNQPETKTAFISLAGRPNVGKSSLLNALLGVKVSMVSAKPQTTRTRITGVLTEDGAQLVFTDTPGVHSPRTVLGEHMVRAAKEGIKDADVCVLVTDAAFLPGEIEKGMIEGFKKGAGQYILALNKIDLIGDKAELLTKIGAYTELFLFNSVFLISCKTGDGVSGLKTELLSLALPSSHFFAADTLTDQPERVLAAEIIREKQLQNLDKEIPHGIAVTVETFKERTAKDGQILEIDAIIFCEKESHKGIIIGKNGAALKRTATAARLDLERFFSCKVNLRCWVKVKEDWRNRQGIIHNFGLDLHS